MPFTDINKTATRLRTKFDRKDAISRSPGKLSSRIYCPRYRRIRVFRFFCFFFSLLFPARQDRRLRQRARDFGGIAYARARRCNKSRDKLEAFRLEKEYETHGEIITCARVAVRRPEESAN